MTPRVDQPWAYLSTTRRGSESQSTLLNDDNSPIGEATRIPWRSTKGCELIFLESSSRRGVPRRWNSLRTKLRKVEALSGRSNPSLTGIGLLIVPANVAPAPGLARAQESWRRLQSDGGNRARRVLHPRPGRMHVGCRCCPSCRRDGFLQGRSASPPARDPRRAPSKLCHGSPRTRRYDLLHEPGT